MPVQVHVTRMLLRHIDIPPDFSVDATNIGELLDETETEHPGFKDSVCDETGMIRTYVNVFVNGERLGSAPEPLAYSLKDGDEVYILENVAGGTNRA